MPRPPSSACLSNRLRQLSLNSPPQSALFYARLYFALYPDENDHDSRHILALCLLEVEEAYSALHTTRQHAWAGCRACAVIVGKCCQALGRFSEGETVMLRALKKGYGSTTLPVLNHSANVYLTLAQLSHKSKSTEAAVTNYHLALQEDSWSWEAFTGLCSIGAPPPADQLFPDPPAMSRASSSRQSRPPTLSPNPGAVQMQMPRSSASEVPAFPPARQALSPTHAKEGGSGPFTPLLNVPPTRMPMWGADLRGDTPSTVGNQTFATPTQMLEYQPQTRRPQSSLISSMLPTSMLPASFRRNPASTSTPVNEIAPPSKPPAMKRARGGNNTRKVPEQPQNGLPMRHNGRDLKSIEPNGEGEPSVRRSTRLKSGPTVAPSRPTNKIRDGRLHRSASATSSTASVEMTSPPAQDSQSQIQADDWLRDVVRRCARAYRALTIYDSQTVINEISTLPSEVRNSAWAIEMIARASYEMANYAQARKAFERLYALEPYRLESTEHYSTLLWHLGDAPALSHLSQTLMSISRESPQAWISAGNLFSLQKDHDEAMRCFKRATQVDPGCAYAWTLCGYEAIEMEEYERAIAFYRTALRTEARHYNAWYGMGLAYMKTGKTRYAEHHFRRAADINPGNAVLLSCIGSVLEQQDDIESAKVFYERACQHAPHSPMFKFKAIRATVALGLIEEAIPQLQSLSRQVEDEAQVFFLLGKCLYLAGRNDEGTTAFTTARELQPKLAPAIESAMKNGGQEDGDDSEAEDVSVA